MVEVVEHRDAGRALLRLSGPGPSLEAVLDEIGELPLPPYIEAARKRMGPAAPAVDDRARYQTVYATSPGAVAAPRAGLLSTAPLLAAIGAAGHEVARLSQKGETSGPTRSPSHRPKDGTIGAPHARIYASPAASRMTCKVFR